MMPSHFLNNEIRRSEIIGTIQNLDLSRPWIIEVKRYRKNRTLGQNALFHKWLSMIAEETGNDKDDIKEYYREKFIPKTTRTIAGEVVLVNRSTSSLNTAEMAALMEKIHAHAATFFSIALPFPGDL